MITTTAPKTPGQYIAIIPGDRVTIWHPNMGRHVEGVVLTAQYHHQRKYGGGTFVDQVTFMVAMASWETPGRTRVLSLSARTFTGDVSMTWRPEVPKYTPEQVAEMLAYVDAHGGPEKNCLVP